MIKKTRVLTSALIVVAITVWIPTQAFATMVLEQRAVDIIDTADLIVIGHVTEKEYGRRGKSTFTFYTVVVEEAIKGY